MHVRARLHATAWATMAWALAGDGEGKKSHPAAEIEDTPPWADPSFHHVRDLAEEFHVALVRGDVVVVGVAGALFVDGHPISLGHEHKAAVATVHKRAALAGSRRFARIRKTKATEIRIFHHRER